MLVLQRKPGEELVIGGSLRLKLVSCPHGAARLELIEPGQDPRPLFQSVGARRPIAPGVHLTVASAGRHFAKLGIDAPRNIEIHRAEVWERIRREKGEAA